MKASKAFALFNVSDLVHVSELCQTCEVPDIGSSESALTSPSYQNHTYS